jgi:hypothetical protein
MQRSMIQSIVKMCLASSLRERLRDDRLRFLLPEISPFNCIRSDYDRQLARTENGTQ